MLDESVIKQAEGVRQLLLQSVNPELIKRLGRSKSDVADAQAALTTARSDLVSHGSTQPKKLSDVEAWAHKQNELSLSVPVYEGVVTEALSQYEQAKKEVRAAMMEVLISEVRDYEARYAQFKAEQGQAKRREGMPLQVIREVYPASRTGWHLRCGLAKGREVDESHRSELNTEVEEMVRYENLETKILEVKPPGHYKSAMPTVEEWEASQIEEAREYWHQRRLEWRAKASKAVAERAAALQDEALDAQLARWKKKQRERAQCLEN